MIGGLGLSAITLAAAGALAVAAVPQATETAPSEAASSIEARAEAQGEALGRLIETRLRAGGPFFTPGERAVIERACGYREGEWDGYDVNISDDVLTCTNGRRAEGPEVRAVLAAAEPRIEARVEALMASPEVRQAIARIAEEATAEALRNVDFAMAGLDDALAGLDGLEIEVDADPGDGVDVDVDVDVDDDTDDDE